MSAVTQVFATYELVERILLELPLRQLLLLQRINKTCHDVFSRSEGIRKALFLVPVSDAAYALSTSHEKRGCSSMYEVPGSLENVRPILNPFLTSEELYYREPSRRPSPPTRSEWVVPGSWSAVLVRLADPNTCRYAFRARDRPERVPGSWGAMLLTQPPTRDLEAVVHIPGSAQQVGVRGCIEGLYEVIAQKESWRACSPKIFQFKHSDAWCHINLDVSIDLVTGSKMLEIMGMSYEDLVDQGLVHKEPC